MKKLVQHIPEPQFKTIRYCGLYATCDHNHKNAVKKMREKLQKPKKNFLIAENLLKHLILIRFYVHAGHIWNTLTIGFHHQEGKMMMTMKTVPEEFEDDLIAKDD